MGAGGPSDRAYRISLSLKRLRYTTSHPNDMTARLIAAHRDLPKLMPYLHLPFQAGSDRILKAMNRKHTMSDYLRIVGRASRGAARISRFRPISSWASREKPKQTSKKRCAPWKPFNSRRPTLSNIARGPVRPRPSATLKSTRRSKRTGLQRLQGLLFAQQAAFNRSMVGRTLDVLWEAAGKRHGQVSGRSPYLQAVHAEGEPALLGRISSVEIVSASQNSLHGVIKN